MNAFEQAKQKRLEKYALDIKTATTKAELLKVRRRVHNLSNWLLTPDQLAYKRELLKISMEELRK